MDHHQAHHEHHRKEREEEKRREHEREARGGDDLRAIHPVWFLVLGSLLTLAVVLTWILI
jgi:hypothetical protein